MGQYSMTIYILPYLVPGWFVWKEVNTLDVFVSNFNFMKDIYK